MTDLQLICFFALEDMTIKELSDRYFEGFIGYVRKMLSGDAQPVQAMIDIRLKQFPKKYREKLKKQRKIEKSLSVGW